MMINWSARIAVFGSFDQPRSPANAPDLHRGTEDKKSLRHQLCLASALSLRRAVPLDALRSCFDPKHLPVLELVRPV